jgi:ABC-2 type transport system ATP-binding protein
MIQVKNVSKVFKVHKKQPGLWNSVKSLFVRETVEKKALNEVNIEIRPGEILGLIGANGAGKTTLVKILSGIIHPSSGEAKILGFTPYKKDYAFLRQISLVMGQKAQLWWDLPAADGFLLLKEIYEVSDEDFEIRKSELCTMLDVHHLLNIPVRRLSLGERMKMELIAALLHQPKVVFLDEPTIGLDLTAQKAVRKFLTDYRKRFHPIMILTSHYMEDIESLCERIAIIKDGGIVYDGSLVHVLRKYANYKNIILTIGENAQKVQELLNTEYSCSLDDENRIRIQSNREDVSHVVADILKKVQVVNDISIVEPNISDIIESLLKVESV